MERIIATSNLQFQNFIDYPDLEITKGKMTFISGESGCGKSTLLKLFNRTLSPSGGQVLYEGVDTMTLDSVALRKEILLVAQTIFLFEGTIAENFKRYYGFREAPMISEGRMQHFLKLSCVDFPLNTLCDILSGGEKQRVFIAICLSFQPKILMLDEPTSALDTQTAHRFFTQIKEESLESERTVIVVSHDKALITEYGDAVIRLERRDFNE